MTIFLIIMLGCKVRQQKPSCMVSFYQRARSAYADLWLNFGFNFPGGCRQIPDKLLVYTAYRYYR